MAGIRVRGRRRPGELAVRRVGAGLVTVAAVAAWVAPGPPGWWLGTMTGLGAAIAWPVMAERGQLALIGAGAVTLGAGLYYAGPWLLPGAVAGAVVGGVVTRGLARRPGGLGSAGADRPYQAHALVCYGDRCRVRGADGVWQALAARPGWRADGGGRASTTRCLGRCREGPVVWLEPAGRLVTHVEPADVPALDPKTTDHRRDF